MLRKQCARNAHTSEQCRYQADSEDQIIMQALHRWRFWSSHLKVCGLGLKMASVGCTYRVYLGWASCRWSFHSPEHPGCCSLVNDVRIAWPWRAVASLIWSANSDARRSYRGRTISTAAMPLQGEHKRKQEHLACLCKPPRRQPL